MRTRALLAAIGLVGLVLSGCLSSDEGGDATPTPTPDAPDPLPVTLEAPTLHPQVLLGMGPGEPSIAAAPDGTLYASSIGPVWRSDDGGASWTEVSDAVDGGGDGDITVTESGRLHWLGLFGDSGPIPYQYSDDRGATWSPSVDISQDTGSDREWIGSRQDSNTVYAAWRGNVDGSEISFTASFDDGETWTDLVEMSGDAVGGNIIAGPIDGQVYQAHATFSGSSDAGIRLARSSDHGETWELVPVLTPPQSVQFGLIGFPFSIFPAVAADANGTVYVVYAVDQDMLPMTVPKPLARFGVYLQVSHDEGDTWTEPRLLSDPAHAAVMPWIDAGAPGRIAVSWYENTLGIPHDNLPDVWNVMLYESIDADTDSPQEVVVQLNGDPAHIGSICTSGTGCLLTAGDRSLLDFFEVVITPDGWPAVVWGATQIPYAGTLLPIEIHVRAVSGGTPLR